MKAIREAAGQDLQWRSKKVGLLLRMSLNYDLVMKYLRCYTHWLISSVEMSSSSLRLAP